MLLSSYLGRTLSGLSNPFLSLPMALTVLGLSGESIWPCGAPSTFCTVPPHQCSYPVSTADSLKDKLFAFCRDDPVASEDDSSQLCPSSLTFAVFLAGLSSGHAVPSRLTVGFPGTDANCSLGSSPPSFFSDFHLLASLLSLLFLSL